MQAIILGAITGAIVNVTILGASVTGAVVITIITVAVLGVIRELLK